MAESAPRRVLRLALAGIAAALALGSCSLDLTSNQARPSAPTTPYHVGAKDFTQIRQLLARRASAVVDANEQAFLATVDKANASFYSSQQVAYDNLEALPVTSMSYEVGESGFPPAAGISGGPLLRPEVVEHVFFGHTDEHPVGNEVDETFVKRSGHWLLAADATDTSDTGGDSARPWAGGRIAVVTRGPLIVVADADLPGGVGALADTVLADLRFDAHVLGVAVDDHLMVDATTSGSVTKFDNNESAAAVTFVVVASKDFQTTAVAGHRVKINPAYISDLRSDPTLLRHELTHYLMSRFSGLNPKWLTEGLAEYVSHQPSGLAGYYIDPSTYDRLMARPRELTVSGLFGQDPHTDYPLAMACVTYLAQHGGMSRLKELMRTYASYPYEPYQDEHTAQALQQVYGLTPTQVAQGAFALLAQLH